MKFQSKYLFGGGAMDNASIMFPILLGRLERPCRDENEERTWHADRRELIDMLNSKPVLRNDGELATIARILHVRVG